MLSTSRKDEQGLVLVMGLIFMAIVSGLTISTINSSTLIEEISYNAQEIAYIEQGTENAAAVALSNDEWVNRSLRIMDQGDQAQFPTYPIAFESDADVEANSNLSAYRELLPGYTIDVDSDIAFVRLQIDSDASLKSNDLSSSMTYGYLRLSAGG